MKAQFTYSQRPGHHNDISNQTVHTPGSGWQVLSEAWREWWNTILKNRLDQDHCTIRKVTLLPNGTLRVLIVPLPAGDWPGHYMLVTLRP